MISLRILLPSVAVALMCLLPVGTVQASGLKSSKTVLIPHRALYKMELGHALKGSNVAGASGTMFYRLEPLCDGWEVESRVSMNLLYGSSGEEEVVQTTWSFTSFESYDGETFTFEVDHNRNGSLEEVFAGQAGKTADGGEASFDDEGTASVKLPAGTVFPADHLIRLLAVAHKGQGHFSKTVFDGASKNNPYDVNAFIIGPVVGGKLAIANASPAPEATQNKLKKTVSAGPAVTDHPLAALPALPVWRIRMAYFPLLESDDLPEFEIEVDYREDGIAERMVQDFGDFSLNLTPSRFEVLPPTACK